MNKTIAVSRAFHYPYFERNFVCDGSCLLLMIFPFAKLANIE
ncbi:MAG: hypothetical protein ACLRSW_10075 [Christensenellaceae bacterium]